MSWPPVNATSTAYLPATRAQVLVGMTLGGTFGFVLDMLLGTDEGFREYLWSAPNGMMYAMGCLYTERFGRYMVTILFDMFLTVILFKLLYSRIVLLAGFTVRGREWIANGFVSTLISGLTFEVYANMTRFQWAYPSGMEDEREQWVSGPTMVLCTVIMNAVFLSMETRTRVGEPGINDPNVKLGVTLVTYAILLVLISGGYIDPSDWATHHSIPSANASAGGPYAPNAALTNVHLPLLGVCETMASWRMGTAIFAGLCIFCLGFVIFVTSAQSLSGLRIACGCCCCCCCCRARGVDNTAGTAASMVELASVAELDSATSAVQVMTASSPLNGGPSRLPPVPTSPSRNAFPVGASNEAVPPAARGDAADRRQGHCCLFAMYTTIVLLVVLAFSVVPLYTVCLACPPSCSSRHPIYPTRRPCILPLLACGRRYSRALSPPPATVCRRGCWRQADEAVHGKRNDTLWRAACDAADKDALLRLGLW